MLKVSKLCKQFASGGVVQTVLDNLELQAEQGQSIAIQGASGCGKSTFLNLLGTLEKPDSGEITVGTEQLHHFTEQQADQFRRAHLGIVFQRFNLIQGLDVWDNVCFPARLNNNLDSDYIEGLLNMLGLADKREAAVENLSGGEQQRVAIVRALAHRPTLLLADEPTGNLDEDNSKRVSQLLYKISKDTNTTLILVTHSRMVAQGADRQFTLSHGSLSPEV